MPLLIEFLITGLAVLLAAYITPGVSVDGYIVAIIVAIVLALVNLIIGSLARLVTAPINFLTLGFISFLISGLLILLTANLVDGFHVNGYIPALIFALILGFIRSLFGMKAKK
jgi:putative membrane protein